MRRFLGTAGRGAGVSGVSRFDCYPSDFLNGVIGLTGDEIAAYTVVMMLQYDRGTTVAYIGREREISVRTGIPRGRLSKAIDRLLVLGKLSLSEGCLFNERTSKELTKISKRLEENAKNSQIGGTVTKEKWNKIRSNINDDIGPHGQPSGMPKQGSLPSSLPPPPPPIKKESPEAPTELLPPKGLKVKPTTGTRLPENWRPQERSLEICLAMGYSRDYLLGEGLDGFRGYWLPLPGAKGRKLDWDQTYCNRMRERADRPRLTGQARASPGGITGRSNGMRAAAERFLKDEPAEREKGNLGDVQLLQLFRG